jgi:hypothetical protein
MVRHLVAIVRAQKEMKELLLSIGTRQLASASAVLQATLCVQAPFV